MSATVRGGRQAEPGAGGGAGAGAPLVELGRTGIRVSPVGIGTWAWGDRMVWGYGREYADDALAEAFQAAVAAGINWFDTAEIYGNGRSERLLGEFLARMPDGHSRVLVASKFMPFPWRLRRRSLLGALRASLRRLGVERIDLYQIHWPYPPVPVETWMEALAEARAEGLIRSAGVSNYSAGQMRRAYEVLARHGIPLASNQVHYSLLHREPERNGVLDACRELGVSLIAYSPLEMGLLTGKYRGERPRGVRGAMLARSGALGRLPSVLGLLQEIGQAHGGKSPAQVALAWLVAKGSLPIPGAKSAAHARQHAQAMTICLGPDEVDALDRAGRP
ncbi:aldo/keto reductase [Carboxydochorda subterranea]|uniref:Aldo/keto reductase n=1 Tax=Carboxydichorda subterranea TaxID=3109565 RepID=A0ABZ1BZU1_9FIRM|nr:aldo/keto reductase [Limnochorda sp. L945t]WRP18095.1 aldo/keto reductase [Limnochorda sp. L945t]